MAGDLLGDDCLNMRNPPGDLGGFLALQGLSEFQGNTLKRLALDDKTRKKT
jgi:hypothetical protein